jgi:hypothetical protein
MLPGAAGIVVSTTAAAVVSEEESSEPQAAKTRVDAAMAAMIRVFTGVLLGGIAAPTGTAHGLTRGNHGQFPKRDELSSM